MEKQLSDWEPTKVTITVLSGRNLQSKRKDNICHATVVFGMGKELFQTEEIHSNEPQWSQDAILNVTGAKPGDHLTFKLRDKDHTTGIVTVPLSSINRRRNEQWWSLQPYKREKEAHGELLLQCWVSEWRPLPTPAGAWADNSPASSCGGSQEDLNHSNGSLKEKARGNHPLPSSGRPSPTISDSDVHIGLSGNLLSDHRQTDPDSSSQVSSQEEINQLLPEVSGISPSEGSVRGNEKVILRGTNLGESLNDILRVVVAGVDCTDTLEYFSSGKVVVTTHSRHCPGSGPVVIETVQGGVGTSSINYHFVASSPSVRLRPGVAKTEPTGSPLVVAGKRKPSSSGPDVTELLAEIKSLKQQLKDMRDSNHDLQEQNTALKSYVDKLLGLIILHNPDLLESQGIES